MTSTTLTNMPRDLMSPSSPSPWGWAWLGVVGVLFFVVFQIILVKSYQHAMTDADWSHALIVPLISLYLVYQSRQELAAAPKRVCWWGLPIFLLGLVVHAFWIYPGQNHMFQGYNMILALFGLVLLVWGWRAMRYLWMPIVYLGFGIKVAEKLWELISLKLQLIAAQGSTYMINFFGAPFDLDAEVRGSTIDLTYKGLLQEPAMEVAEACSGLRSLMAFIALGVAVAFVSRGAWWRRLIVILSTVPIALLINVLRVTILGFIYPHDRELASGDFHGLIGMLMLIPAAGLFLLVGWVLDRVFVVDEQAVERKAAASASAGPVATPTDPALTASMGPAATWPWPSAGVAAGVALTLAVGGVYLLCQVLGFDVFQGLASVTSGLGLPSYTELPMSQVVLMAVLLPLLALLALPVWALLKSAGPLAGRRAQAVALGLCIGVLGTTALSQTIVLNQTRAVMFKEAVPLRHDLYALPKQVGSWQLLKTEPSLDPEIEKTLGTDKYITAFYKDADVPNDQPGRIVRLHVAYYTGMIDTVPHVPDRCWLGAGLAMTGGGFTDLELDYPADRPDPDADGVLVPTRLLAPAAARLPAARFETRYVSFADPRNPGPEHHVMYFFVVNGRFLSTAEAVRVEGFNMTDRYSYYCKVEVQVLGAPDPDFARGRVESFLSPMLPEIMSCLPDWVDVRAGRYPAQAEAR